MVKFAYLVSGKRKSGKDFCSNIISDCLKDRHQVKIIGVSDCLKREYAKENGLSYEQLLSDSSYKEKYRESMIAWGEEKRKKDPHVFCREALKAAGECDVLIVSDCRRLSDIEFFQSKFPTKHTTVRILANDSARVTRGYVFTPGVDDAESECGLDDFVFDNYYDNITTEDDARQYFGIIVAVSSTMF